MSKTTKNILVEDFYKTTFSNLLPNSWDLEINVLTPPTNNKGFIIIDPDNDSSREAVPYYNVVWNTIYVKKDDRTNPKEHIEWGIIQINDTSLIFNYLSKLNSTTFYIEKLNGLDIKVNWWPVAKWLETIEVLDTNLSLIDWTTNYIFYVPKDNLIKSTSTESVALAEKWIIIAEVITASNLVISINYRHHWLFIWNFIESITKTWTTWLVDTYTITYTDWSSSTFDVENWNWISNITKTWTSWLVDTYTINYTNWSSTTFDVTNWEKWEKWDIWKSITTITSNKVNKTTTITINWDFDNSPQTFTIEDWQDWTWIWDMLKSVYDTTDSWIVDNAEKVNWLTVETAVPSWAVFTDTVYSDAEIKTKYENNANTNAYTDAEKTKVWVITTTWDWTSYLANDWTYKTITSGWASFNWVNWQSVIISWSITEWIIWEATAFDTWTFWEMQASISALWTTNLTFTVEKNGTQIGTVTIPTNATATNGRYYATSTDLADWFVANDVITIKKSWTGWSDLILNLK